MRILFNCMGRRGTTANGQNRHYRPFKATALVSKDRFVFSHLSGAPGSSYARILFSSDPGARGLDRCSSCPCGNYATDVPWHVRIVACRELNCNMQLAHAYAGTGRQELEETLFVNFNRKRRHVRYRSS